MLYKRLSFQEAVSLIIGNFKFVIQLSCTHILKVPIFCTHISQSTSSRIQSSYKFPSFLARECTMVFMENSLKY